jgi:putative redox protein
VERIDRLVYMDGELSAAERERLVQIADRCPVHQTLHGPIEVHTREASDEV